MAHLAFCHFILAVPLDCQWLRVVRLTKFRVEVLVGVVMLEGELVIRSRSASLS